MARAKPEAGAAADFLTPLRKMALRYPDLDALVFWANPDWSSEPAEDMDAEEAPFYAEGLIPEGFSLEWRLMAAPGDTRPDHFQLFVWDQSAMPPGAAEDWILLASARWQGGGAGSGAATAETPRPEAGNGSGA